MSVARMWQRSRAAPAGEVHCAPGQGLTHLRLLAFERHDLVLAKRARDTDRDREDVVALARGPGLDVDVLRLRYQDELRPPPGAAGPRGSDAQIARFSNFPHGSTLKASSSGPRRVLRCRCRASHGSRFVPPRN